MQTGRARAPAAAPTQVRARPFAQLALRAQPDREHGCRTWTSGATEKSEAFINDRRINLNKYLCELARSSDAARFPYFLIFAGGERTTRYSYCHELRDLRWRAVASVGRTTSVRRTLWAGRDG